MKELEAINMLLRTIGSSPVNTVTSAHPDAANAKVTLDRVRKRVQKRGWWFNSDYGVKFYPDSVTQEITIPDELTTTIFSETQYVKRGNKLYDKLNNTYKIPNTVIAIEVVRILDWDDMAESCTEYCAAVAAAEFIRDEIEDPTKESSFHKSAGEAKLYLDAEELSQGQYNMFNQRRVVRARRGVHPYGGLL